MEKEKFQNQTTKQWVYKYVRNIETGISKDEDKKRGNLNVLFLYISNVNLFRRKTNYKMQIAFTGHVHNLYT